MLNNNYQIIKSKRRSLGIMVKFDGSVIVRVPLQTPSVEINKFLYEHKDWINAKLASFKIAHENKAKNNLYYYLGEQYLVNECDLDGDLVSFNGQELLIQSGFTNQTKTILIQWYTLQAKELAEPIIHEYSSKLGLIYSRVKITSAKNRWGSCNSYGTICFSYRIAMLPLSVIKYIVVHELAHLKHLNHSQAFWQLVEQIYPNYKSAHDWLKQHKYNLAVSI